ncbi:MAG: hypothetical protein EKK46_01365 [Rhodocyclaceae bacterium]|nr:MAG: hypothetical protein EKK46_01365 [Rhodocyclaceae bacterium]
MAIPNATVTIKCATGGTQTGTTNAAGVFSISIASGAGPCVAAVDTGAAAIVSPNGNIPAHTIYHGYIAASEIVSNAGTINITPLTEEILRIALNPTTTAAFFGQASVGTISSSALANAESQVLTDLSGRGASIGGITALRTQSFTALTTSNTTTNPDVIDTALDLVVASGSYTVTPPAVTYVVSTTVTDYQNSGSTVTAAVGAVSCSDATTTGTTCASAAIGTGTPMTLTATPAGGYGAIWGGACASAGTGNTCNITVDAAKSVTVRFDPKGSTIWWVATTGSDSNNGRTPATAYATFHKALTSMSGGDTLYIDDGTYHESIGGFGGAYSRWDTSVCGGSTTSTPPCVVTINGSRNEGPNGISSGQRTKILGYRTHAVKIDASTAPNGSRIGLEIFKGQHIEVANIVFMHTPDMGPVHIEQANDIYIHQVGAAFPDPTSASDNNRAHFFVGDSNAVVIEESWGWGYGGRYGVVFHGGTNNVARRNVFRYDGSPDGQPKAGVTLYSEDNTIAENNIVIDFNNGPDNTGDVHAPLFSTCSSALSAPSLVTGLGSIGWYGNMAINTTGQTNANFFFDSLCSIGGTVTVKDNIVQGIGASGGTTVAGLWVSNDTGTHLDIVLQNNTIYNMNGRGVRVDAPPRWNSVTFNSNIVDLATGQCFQDVSAGARTFTSAGNQVFGCSTTSVPNDATTVTTDPSLTFLLRGTGGRGATVDNRYNNGTLTGTVLWPFPNETNIKTDMCQADTGGSNETSAAGWTGKYYTRGHGASGWCASGKTLTKYIWEQLPGSTSPY